MCFFLTVLWWLPDPHLGIDLPTLSSYQCNALAVANEISAQLITHLGRTV